MSADPSKTSSTSRSSEAGDPNRGRANDEPVAENPYSVPGDHSWDHRLPEVGAGGTSGERLQGVLGTWSAIMLVMGAVIGSGIFLKPNVVAQATSGHLGLILLLWVGCGLVNLCGALTLAELATLMPHAGGTYVYLRQAYGRLWAFLWGWSELLIIRSGSIAALAAAMVISIRSLLEFSQGITLSHGQETAIAIATVVLLAVVNAVGTTWGGAVQNVTTVVKAGFVLVLAVLPFLAASGQSVAMPAAFPQFAESTIWVGLGTALFGIMWAYDGWGNLGVVAEDLHQPARSIPVALIVGVVVLIVLYTGVNLAFHLTLPWQEIAKSPVPAITVTERISENLGWQPGYGYVLMNMILLISVFGALNANVLAGPRVLFAMARDRVFLGIFGRISQQFRTPAVAIVGLSLWSIVLIMLAEWTYQLQPWLTQQGWLSQPIFDANNHLFNVMVRYCLFGGSIFYLSAVAAVFILRRSQPHTPRPYRTWGYPLVPAVFVVAYVLLLGFMLASEPLECLVGLGLIALGAGVYFLMPSSMKSEATQPEANPPQSP